MPVRGIGPPNIPILDVDQALREAAKTVMDAAAAILLGNNGYQAFLAGPRHSNALETLGRMQTNNQIQIGDVRGYIAATFCGPYGAFCTTGLTNGTIVLDRDRFFGGAIGWASEFGISQKQAQVLILLHEIGHSTGAIPFDGFLAPEGTSSQNTRDVFNACFQNR